MVVVVLVSRVRVCGCGFGVTSGVAMVVAWLFDRMVLSVLSVRVASVVVGSVVALPVLVVLLVVCYVGFVFLCVFVSLVPRGRVRVFRG